MVHVNTARRAHFLVNAVSSARNRAYIQPGVYMRQQTSANPCARTYTHDGSCLLDHEHTNHDETEPNGENNPEPSSVLVRNNQTNNHQQRRATS